MFENVNAIKPSKKRTDSSIRQVDVYVLYMDGNGNRVVVSYCKHNCIATSGGLQ